MAIFWLRPCHFARWTLVLSVRGRATKHKRRTCRWYNKFEKEAVLGDWMYPFGGYEQKDEVRVEEEKADDELAAAIGDGEDDDLVSLLDELENC